MDSKVIKQKKGDEYMAKLIVLGGLIYGGYWLYQYACASEYR